MKRLIRRAKENINQQQVQNIEQNENSMIDTDMIEKLRQEVMDDMKNVNDTNMILLNQLDEADVRHDICPNCKYQPMVRKEGFKVCPSCGKIYKMLNGKGYMILG